MKWFTNCKTLEDLKAEYKKLVFKHHPDRGGDTATMQEINGEYEVMFERVKNIHRNKDGETYEKENTEKPNEFRDTIEKLIKMSGVHIEIIGCFIWVSGNTKPYKDDLKEIGFKWHSKKVCWYLAPADYKKRSKKEFQMNEIRNMYGVQFEADGEDKTAKLTA